LVFYAYKASDDYTTNTVEEHAIEKLVWENRLVKLKAYNTKKKFLEIEIHGYYTLGTDSACLAFGRFVKSLTDIDPNLSIWVTGRFVPSLYNPISRDWAKILADPSRVEQFNRNLVLSQKFN
jgi:hypothetical protein